MNPGSFKWLEIRRTLVLMPLANGTNQTKECIRGRKPASKNLVGQYREQINHAKVLKGWSPRDAPRELVPQWDKTFPCEHVGRMEMKTPAGLSNKTSTANSCAEN